MHFKILLTVFVIILLQRTSLAQDTTKVFVSLKIENESSLKIRVYPPKESSKWTYVIPKIIPGTYLKINYHELYESITAVDNNGKKIKVKQSDNKFIIDGKKTPLSYLEYSVSQSFGRKKIWDNAFGCAGTIYSEDAFLLNFQLINGYFEDFQNQPFLITLDKQRDLYGATSMTCVTRTSSQDVFLSTTYDALIDQPVLYAKADTSSFTIDDNRFKVAVYSGSGYKSAKELVPGLKNTMSKVKSLSGFTSEKDYHFLFYFVGWDKLRSASDDRFGLGSALEHTQSSVYYYFDNPYYAPDFSDMEWIVAHEYLHTITPLSLHSEKIRNFNFAEPDMSQHLWLYEGVTDYLAALIDSKDDTVLMKAISNATSTAENNSSQSMTESSLEIAKNTKSNFDQKLKELNNFH